MGYKQEKVKKNSAVEHRVMPRRGKREMRKDTVAFAVTVSFLARSRKKNLASYLTKPLAIGQDSAASFISTGSLNVND